MPQHLAIILRLPHSEINVPAINMDAGGGGSVIPVSIPVGIPVGPARVYPFPRPTPCLDSFYADKSVIFKHMRYLKSSA